MTKPTYDHGTFSAQDDTDIFFQSWTSARPRALMVIAHGIGEHGGRYMNVVDTVHPLGIGVFASDHRGHGRSGGKRGHVTRFGLFIDDLRAMVELAEARVPGVPVILLGHSMGGLIALTYATAHPETIDYLVVSSPALGVSAPIPKIKEILGRKLSDLWPSLALASGLDATAISRDPHVVAAYKADPLVHDRVSARFFTELTGQMERTMADAEKLRVPVLVQSAGSDRLVNADSTERYYERIGSSDHTFHRYETYFHEIYNDLQKEVPLGDLAAWLEARLTRAGKGADPVAP
jgi:alpha-beta hydrolase superfamily lysophospholipase